MDTALRSLLALERDEMVETLIPMDRRPLLALMVTALVALSERGFLDEVCVRCGRVNPVYSSGWLTVASGVVCPGCRKRTERDREQFAEAEIKKRGGG
jgi:hypothetical protein